MKIFAIALLRPQEKDVEAQTQESWKGLQPVREHNNCNVTAVQKPALENRAQQDTLADTSSLLGAPIFPLSLAFVFRLQT